VSTIAATTPTAVRLLPSIHNTFSMYSSYNSCLHQLIDMQYSPLSSIQQDIEAILERSNDNSPNISRIIRSPTSPPTTFNNSIRSPLLTSSYDTPRPKAHYQRHRQQLKYFSLARWMTLRNSGECNIDPNLDASQRLLSAATIRGDTQKCSAKTFAEYEGCMRNVENTATRMGQETDYMLTPYSVQFLVHYIRKAFLLYIITLFSSTN